MIDNSAKNYQSRLRLMTQQKKQLELLMTVDSAIKQLDLLMTDGLVKKQSVASWLTI